MVTAVPLPRHDNWSNTGGRTICSTIDCGLCVMRHLHSLLAMYKCVWTPCVLHQWRGQNGSVCGPHNILSHSCWEILQGSVCLFVCLFDLWGLLSLQHKPGLLYCARSSWCQGWGTDWTNSFCKYCVSMKIIVLKCIKWMHFLLLPLGAELPLMVENVGLLNDIFPFPSILDTGYPVFNLHLANILFDIILPSILGSSL